MTPPPALAIAPPTGSAAFDVEIERVDAHGYVAVGYSALPESEAIDFDQGLRVLERASAIEESEHTPVSKGPFGI